jgi:6-phosphogluconolactonase (cycloisomerase 2 family)
LGIDAILRGVQPDGRFLLVGNQDSGTLSVFAAAPETGALQHRCDVAMAAPMCILAIPGHV